MKSNLHCLKPCRVAIGLAALAFLPAARATTQVRGEDTGLARFTTTDTSVIPQPREDSAALATIHTYAPGSIFSRDLPPLPNERNLSSGRDSIAMYIGKSDGLNDAAFRSALRNPHDDPEEFWLRSRREAKQFQTSDTTDAEGFTGTIAGISFPSHALDWVTTIQFTTALVGLSLVAGLLLRFRKSDPLRISPTLTVIGKEGR